MSDKALIPTPDVLHTSGNALVRYRHAFSALNVFERAENGRRVEVNDDGRMVIFDLSEDQAKHLAGLLTAPVASS